MLVVDKSTDHDKPHFNYHNINVKENVFFFRARAEKGIARHIDASVNGIQNGEGVKPLYGLPV